MSPGPVCEKIGKFLSCGGGLGVWVVRRGRIDPGPVLPAEFTEIHDGFSYLLVPIPRVYSHAVGISLLDREEASAGGSLLWVTLPEETDTLEIYHEALKRNILIAPLPHGGDSVPLLQYTVLNQAENFLRDLFGESGMVSLGRGEYKIRCIRGSLWATWPGSGDCILGAGDGISVRQQGKI